MDIKDYVMLNKFRSTFGGTSNVYLLREGQCYKIGVSNDISRRLSDLQSGNSRKIEVVAHFKAPEDYCYVFEGAMHRRFSNSHVSGEWFCLSSEELGKLLSQMRAHEKMFESVFGVIHAGEEPTLWNVLGIFLDLNPDNTVVRNQNGHRNLTTPKNTVVEQNSDADTRRLESALGGVLEEVKTTKSAKP
jgi:hypothetical protein